MAWRSQEQSQHFKRRLKDTKKSGHKQYDGIVPDNLPDEFYAKEDIRDKRGRLVASKGDIYLGQVKGEQARQYFQSLGIPMPDGGSRISVTDPTIVETYGRKGPGRRR